MRSRIWRAMCRRTSTRYSPGHGRVRRRYRKGSRSRRCWPFTGVPARCSATSRAICAASRRATRCFESTARRYARHATSARGGVRRAGPAETPRQGASRKRNTSWSMASLFIRSPGPSMDRRSTGGRWRRSTALTTLSGFEAAPRSPAAATRRRKAGVGLPMVVEYASRAVVTVDGTAMAPDVDPNVEQVVVDHHLHLPDMFSITFLDPTRNALTRARLSTGQRSRYRASLWVAKSSDRSSRPR